MSNLHTPAVGHGLLAIGFKEQRSGLFMPIAYSLLPIARLLIPVQPPRGGPAYVSDGMYHIGWDKDFFPGLGPERPPLHFQFQLSFNDHQEFIYGMNIILPYLTRRINPQVAGETAGEPELLNLSAIYRHLRTRSMWRHRSPLIIHRIPMRNTKDTSRLIPSFLYSFSAAKTSLCTEAKAEDAEISFRKTSRPYGSLSKTTSQTLCWRGGLSDFFFIGSPTHNRKQAPTGTR
jgi:hypothetical protein